MSTDQRTRVLFLVTTPLSKSLDWVLCQIDSATRVGTGPTEEVDWHDTSSPVSIPTIKPDLSFTKHLALGVMDREDWDDPSLTNLQRLSRAYFWEHRGPSQEALQGGNWKEEDICTIEAVQFLGCTEKSNETITKQCVSSGSHIQCTDVSPTLITHGRLLGPPQRVGILARVVELPIVRNPTGISRCGTGDIPRPRRNSSPSASYPDRQLGYLEPKQNSWRGFCLGLVCWCRILDRRCPLSSRLSSGRSRLRRWISRFLVRGYGDRGDFVHLQYYRRSEAQDVSSEYGTAGERIPCAETTP